MIEFLKKLFETQEDIETKPKKAEKLYRKYNSSKIKTAEEKSDNLIERTSDIIEEIETELENMKDYEDRQNIQAVEDIAENFFKSRKKIIEDFNPSEDIEEHSKDIEQFLSSFEDTSRKEAAVMKRAKEEFKTFFKTIEDLNNHLKNIEEFIDDEYTALKDLKQVKKLLHDLEKTEKRIENVEKEIESNEIEEVQNELEDKKKQIEQIKKGDEWERKEFIESQIEKTQRDRKRIVKNFSKNVSKIERGIKKITYSVENEGTAFNGDLNKLKALKRKEFKSVEDPGPMLEEAAKVIENKDLLDPSQKVKFREAVEKFEDFSSRIEKMERLTEEEKNLEEQLEDVDIVEKLNDVEKEASILERDLKNSKEELERLEDRKKELEKTREDTIEELEDLLNRSTRHSISLEAP